MEQQLFGVFAARAFLFEEPQDEDEEMRAVHRIQQRNARFRHPPPVRV